MNSVPLNDLSRLSDTEVDQLTQSFRHICASGTYLKGSATADFESKLSMMHKGREVVAVANGTDALTLAMASFDLPVGSKIAVTPNAGGYSTTAALRTELSIELIDIDESNGQMSPSALLASLRADPTIKAVVLTHLYGLTGDVVQIAEICKEHSVILIEDCAQSIGAKVGDTPVGAFGDIATFSFYPTKNLGGLGDGGAVICKDSVRANIVRELAQYGWSTRYLVSRIRGFNSRIDEVQAAILSYRLQTLNLANARRREIINRYQNSVNSPRRFLSRNDDSFVGHLAILVSPDREGDKQTLEGDGIQTGIHYPYLDSEQPAWKNHVSLHWNDISNAVSLNSQILTIPCFPSMTEDEVTQVCNSLRKLT